MPPQLCCICNPCVPSGYTQHRPVRNILCIGTSNSPQHASDNLRFLNLLPMSLQTYNYIFFLFHHTIKQDWHFRLLVIASDCWSLLSGSSCMIHWKELCLLFTEVVHVCTARHKGHLNLLLPFILRFVHSRQNVCRQGRLVTGVLTVTI